MSIDSFSILVLVLVNEMSRKSGLGYLCCGAPSALRALVPRGKCGCIQQFLTVFTMDSESGLSNSTKIYNIVSSSLPHTQSSL